MIARRLPAVLLACSFASASLAADIEGVLPASLDQPRIYVAISVDAKSKPLAAKGGSLEDLLGGALGTKGEKEEIENFAVEAFLDTGASGIMLSQSTAEALGIAPAKTADGREITFYDVGVAGKEPFLVTGSYYLRSSEYSGNTDGMTFEDYSPPTGPIRLKIREGGGGMLEAMMGSIDVAGMPLMMGKVMVLDARPLDQLDKLKTSLVPSDDKSIPKTDVAVSLTYVNYARFTQTDPPTAPTVQLAPNPMIGPDPFDKSDRAKPVTISHKGKSAALTMLLDTGAASSMISTAKAKQLGIEIDEDGKLTNVPANEQFTLPIGGIGGAKNVNGFFVDVVQLPTVAGEPIRYLKAPFLVMDISVTDEKSGEAFTLDGVFGMNYLVASASISSGLMAGIADTHGGAFDFIVIDHARKTMGLKLRK